MAKFSGSSARNAPGRGVVTTTDAPAVTHEGGRGFDRSPKSELFLLGVVNMVSEDTFYESAEQRDERFKRLIHQVTAEDPDWVRRYLRWLRADANMRSAPVVGAVEYVKAGGPKGRTVVASVCQRADEPAEVIGYHLATHGRKIPKAVKRGVADAATRLYTEKAVLKYDGKSRGVRMADVIELTHPTPKSDAQSRLFKYLLDQRHNEDGNAEELGLKTIARAKAFDRGEITDVRAVSGVWERTGKKTAADWEALIPNMGYMALLRNLRNFDEAGISAAAQRRVAEKLTDPNEVASSRQFPFRFYSAFRELASLSWGPALEQALVLSLKNVPTFERGRTAVLVDTSASMRQPLSGKSKVSRIEVSGVFAAAIAVANPEADVYVFADDVQRVPVPKASAALNVVKDVERLIGRVGHGTMIHTAINAVTKPDTVTGASKYHRVIVVTDDQAWDGTRGRRSLYVRHAGARPLSNDTEHRHVPFIHTINVGGYKSGSMDLKPGRYTFGGLTDQVFSAIPLVESGDDENWPF